MGWWALLACTGSAPPIDTDTDVSPETTAVTGDTGCVALPWYPDTDLDGIGDADGVVTSCVPPPGSVSTGGDCDDQNAALTGVLDPIRFRPVPADTSGLVQPHWDGQYRPCVHEATAGGGAVGDVDGDGDLDLFQPRLYLADQLLLNDGTGTFAPAPGFVGDAGASSGSLFVDVDGDRDLDLFVARLGASPSLLYINDGTGGLTEDAVARGVDLPPSGCSDQWGVSASDVDGDGDLDLLIAGWMEELEIGLHDRSRLLLNDGTGHFVDATVAWGLDVLRDHAAFGLLLADRDGDGDPDLHVVADWGGSGFWRNDGDRFVQVPGPFTDENGMGSDLGDVDGDGDLDWFVSSIWDNGPGPCPDGWGCTGNRLYVDDGGTFGDGTDAAGVREGQWGWGSVFLDDDLDGDLDLVMTGGFPAVGFQAEPGRLYRNDGSGRFSDRTCEAGWTYRDQGRTLLPVDIERDGDLDLFVVDSVRAPTLWRAEGAEGRTFLALDLDQPGPNRFAVGATVTVTPTPSAPSQVRLLHANALFAGGPAPEVHFGLGDPVGPLHEVRVRWPDGAESTYSDVDTGRVTLVRDPAR